MPSRMTPFEVTNWRQIFRFSARCMRNIGRVCTPVTSAPPATYKSTIRDNNVSIATVLDTKVFEALMVAVAAGWHMQCVPDMKDSRPSKGQGCEPCRYCQLLDACVRGRNMHSTTTTTSILFDFLFYEGAVIMLEILQSH